MGGGDKVKISFIPFTNDGTIQDMNPAAHTGLVTYTTAFADLDNNSIPDYLQILNSYTSGGSSKFTQVVQKIDTLINVLPGTPNVIYMSDGYGYLDPTVAKTLANDVLSKGGNLNAFAIGSASTYSTLLELDPNAIQVVDINELTDIFSGFDDRYAKEPFMNGVTVYLDQNNNSQLDPGESYQITQQDKTPNSLDTNSKYYFSFKDLLPGTYTVRTLLPSGYTMTTPTTNVWTDTITAVGETKSNLFGLTQATIVPPNQDPIFLTTPPNVTLLKADQELRYNAFARDPDADIVTYDLVTAPEGMAVDAHDGIVVWSPTSAQVDKYYQDLYAEQARLTAIGRGAYAPTDVEFNVLLRATDGQGGQALQYMKVQLVPNNHPPLFTSTSPNNAQPQVGKPFQYQTTATDPDNDPVTFSLVNPPSGAVINANTGLLTWTPTANQLGNQQFSIQVQDSFGNSNLQSVNLTVVLAHVNHSPVFTSTPRTSTKTQNPYIYNLQATDPDNDPLTFSLVNAPVGMTLNQGVIVWQPTASQFGNNSVSVQVSDGQGGTTTQSWTIQVSNQLSNLPPTITSTPSKVTSLGRTYTYKPTAIDSDSDRKTWSLVSDTVQGMVIDEETGTIVWQPTANQIGDTTVRVQATDIYGAYNVQEFTIHVNGINSPPKFVSTPITIAGVGQGYSYQALATDPENDALIFTLGSKPSGMTITSYGLIQWTPTANQVGKYDIQVIATDDQGASTNQTYTLIAGTTPVNHPPVISSTPVFLAAVGHTYNYQVAATDADNNPITYQLLSAPDGMTIDANTGLLTWANPVAGSYQVVVGADDGIDGAALGFTLQAKTITPPIIQSTTPPTTAIPNTLYRYDLIAFDPQGDRLTYSIDAASQNLGMILDSQGRLSWTPNNAQVGDHAVTLTVTDSAGFNTQQTFNLNVTPDTVAPKVKLIASYDLINLGESITFQARATDNTKVAGLQLLIDGTPIVLDSNGMARYTPTQAGTIIAKAYATDSAGNIGQASFNVAVIDTSDVSAPDVSLDLGAYANGTVTAPVDIKGTVSDDNLDYYRLLVAPIGSSDFREIFRGTSTVNDGVLGKFDPSLLENDSYTLRLEAHDKGGNVSFVEDTVNVSGELKLGNFRLSFTDLSIPVTGIPITLTRTYDSLTSGSTDDFGYGWRMEFRDTDLRTSVGKPTGEVAELGGQNPFKDGTKVYITLPGGKREGFSFKPTIDPLSQYLRGAGGVDSDPNIYHTSFVADAGVTDTLTVQNTRIIHGAGTNQYYGLAGSAYNPADTYYGGVYVLTTKEGIVYQIDAATGDLLTVTDTNGNTLTYTDADITSSTGQKITFGRDAQGRIATVTDPAGKQIHYQYNAQGDLISVTDREGNTTQMEYDTERSHYLDKIIDPLGRTGVKNEYGDDGRLKYLEDVNGQKVEMSYDPNNSRQTVLDQLGHATVYEYDARGNILTEIDAEGKITKRTYDDDNNLKTETIITDETGPNGYTTSYTYDAKGNQLTRTNPLNQTDYYTYNSFGQLLTSTNPLGYTTTYTYDKRGNVTSKTDAVGNKTTYTYYANGNPWTITEGTNDVTTFEYDGFGNRTKKIDALGNEITYTYDLNGNQETETKKLTTPTGVRTLVTTQTYDRSGKVKTILDAENGLTQYDYDVDGNQILVIDALGRRTEMRYNEKNKLIETILPDDTPDTLLDNPRIKYDYDGTGNRTAITNQDGRTTYYTYDPLNRPTGMILPDATPDDLTDNPHINVEYNKAGQMKSLIQDGVITEFEYNAAGDITLTRNHQNGQIYEIKTVYDKAERKVSTTDALNHTTKFVYDGLDRLIETIYADNTKTQTTYNAAGKVLTQTDQFERVTRYEYDALDQLKAVIDTKQNRTEYSYDEAGNLTYQKDANNNVTHFEYDGLGRRIAVVRPMQQRSSSLYDKVGNIIETVDFNGDTIKYDYDINNRLIAKHFLNEDNRLVEYTYTAAGQRDTITDSQGVTDYDYNAQGRLISVTNPDNKNISYIYDSATGKLASLTTPDGTTSYRYNSLGQLEKVIAANGETTYAYDAVGNLEQMTLPNGNTQSYKYNNLNQLNVLETKDRNNNLLAKYIYTYDKIGNTKLVEELDGRKVEFDYDEVNRLIKETITDPVNGNRTIEYGYDNVGNRLTRKDSQTGEKGYIYDKNDRLLSETLAGVTTTYSYDNNGNVINVHALGKEVVYDWNSENLLIGANITTATGTQQLSYRYNANGIRVASIVDGQETRYLIDANRSYAQVLEEYTPTGQTQVSYVHGLDLISQTREGVSEFYLEDRQSGVRQLSDASGVITDTYNYDAYGNLLQSTGNTQNNYLYRGEQVDSNLGMQYLRARYYNQNQGQFASVDPFEGTLEQPITQHRYIYGNDNPVNYVDPSGAMASLLDFGAFSALESSLAGLSIPGLVTVAGIATAAFISGAKQRLKANGVLWEGEILSQSLPYIPSAKFASLQSTGSTVIKGDWAIVSYSLIPDLKAGVSLGISTTPVEVIAKPQSPDSLPSVWDLAGIYLAPKFKIKFPLPNGNEFKSSLEDPGFFMGWGYGKEKPGASKFSFEVSFSLGIDQGLSIPLTSQRRNDPFPYLPE